MAATTVEMVPAGRSNTHTDYDRGYEDGGEGDDRRGSNSAHITANENEGKNNASNTAAIPDGPRGRTVY